MIFLLDLTIKVSVILGIALVTVFLLRRQSAALRHWILTAAIVCAVITPLLGVIVPAWEIESTVIPALPSTEWASSANPAEISFTTQMAKPPAPATHQPVAEATAPTRTAEARPVEPVAAPSEKPIQESVAFSPKRVVPAISLEQSLGLLWAGGTVLGLVLLIAGTLRMAWITSRSEPVLTGAWAHLAVEVARSYGLRRPLRMFRSPYTSILATWGIVRPEVLLPACSGEWSEDRIRVVLSHELAHIRRGDWPIQVAAGVIRAIYWFNPLIWMVYRQLRQESEQSCDDTVIAGGMAGPEYAAHLLAVARTLNTGEPSWAPGLLMARPSTLQKRIEVMLTPGLNRNRVTRASVVLIVASFLCVAAPVAALRATPKPAGGISLLITPPPPAAATALPPAQPSPVANVVQAIVAVAAQLAPLASSPPDSTASVEGIVVRQGTNQPLTGVTVELRKLPPNAAGGNASPTSAAQILSFKTADDGRFVFRNVQPGDWRLMGSREDGSYSPQEYLWKPSRLRGVAIPLAAGQVLKDARIELAPTVSISGRIVDRDGEPVGNARVLALQPWYEYGKPQMSLVQVTQTNDRGEYRFYWLPAGKYYVAVRPESADARMVRTMPNVVNIASIRGEYRAFEGVSAIPLARRVDNGQVVEETYELVYYPGVTDSQKARTVDPAPGANLNGVDISLAPGTVKARTIKGSVLNSATGQPAGGARIYAIPQNPSPSIIMPSATTAENGSFTLTGLTTEPYTFIVTVPGAPLPPGAAPGTLPNPPLSAFVPIDFGNADIENLAVVLKPGFSVSGRITVDGQLPGGNEAALARLQVRFAPDISIHGYPVASSFPNLTGPVTSEGNFTVPGVGPTGLAFGIAVGPQMPPGAYLKSVRIGPTDVLQDKLRVENSPPGPIEIVLGVGMGSLDIVVRDEKLEPYVNGIVVLLPASPSQRRFELHKSLPSNATGRTQFVDIVPGDYKMFAWDQMPTGGWFDPDLMRNYESRGKLVQIRGGTKETAEIDLIRSSQ